MTFKDFSTPYSRDMYLIAARYAEIMNEHVFDGIINKYLIIN